MEIYCPIHPDQHIKAWTIYQGYALCFYHFQAAVQNIQNIIDKTGDENRLLAVVDRDPQWFVDL